MVGLAMLVLAAIFGGAAFFRKRVLEMVTEAVTGSITRNATSSSIQSIMDKLKMVRNIGIADTIMDWMDLRRREPPLDKTPRPARPGDNIRVDSGRFPEILDPVREEPWEGYPPEGYPYRELTGRTVYDIDGEERDVWEGQPPESGPPPELPAGKGAGVDLNTARATPAGVAGAKAAGMAAVGTAEATAATEASAVAGPAGVAVAVGAAAAKKVKEFTAGEAGMVTRPAGPGGDSTGRTTGTVSDAGAGKGPAAGVPVNAADIRRQENGGMPERRRTTGEHANARESCHQE